MLYDRKCLSFSGEKEYGNVGITESSKDAVVLHASFKLNNHTKYHILFTSRSKEHPGGKSCFKVKSRFNKR